MTTPNALHARLISIETDGDYAPDFRRLVCAARQKLGTALRKRDGAWISEVATEARELLSLWDVPAVAS